MLMMVIFVLLPIAAMFSLLLMTSIGVVLDRCRRWREQSVTPAVVMHEEFRAPLWILLSGLAFATLIGIGAGGAFSESAADRELYRVELERLLGRARAEQNADGER